jgi:multidrug efflux pump subunit AcrA (membrane-fusion protein)
MRAARWTAVVVFVALAAGLGWLARGRWGGAVGSDGTAESPCPGGAKPLYWQAPMTPGYRSDKPGKSPMGMDLVPVCPAEEGASSGQIRVSPVIEQSIGVKTRPVARRDLARIERLHVSYTGQAVKRGEPLLALYSPELVSTQQELLLAARYQKETAASPFPDVAEGGSSLFEAARERLRLWDIPQSEIDRLLRTGRTRKALDLMAPSDGYVTKLDVREGSEIRPDDPLYTIADLSHVWVYADVYQSELPWVALGQKATVELSYLPEERFEGRVDYVYPVLEGRTRTVKVRIDLPNPDGVLKPDMWANVTIATEPLHDVLAVPEEAVLRSGKRTLVMLALGDGRFEPREVTLGVSTGDGWVQIRSGLHEKEEIVTSGQFLLDSESNLREAAQQFTAPKE